ncbi:NADH-quinone oxidoreductase subunit J [Aquaspirillum serpens]|uniref:NADH-quinone oxidoreductase subunit J n=1 Tax=Aquaspirillum serpens TaxID=190 RepID=UPI0003B69B2A|nr:NADH-quinone oxidoreductase subunit J [Aquaspirillum serpens]
MSFQEVVFYVLSAIVLYSGLRVVTAKNPVHAALFLVLAFFSAAGHWLLMQAEFLAIALVLVYVGAVMVLFLFVVMMLDINFEKLHEGFWRHLPLAGTVAVIMIVEMVMVLLSPSADLSSMNEIAPLAEGMSNVRELGLQIYTTYLLPFELAAVLLLLAIVAAIALTMRKRKDTKYIDPAVQVRVQRADRVRVLKMDAEPRANADTDNNESAA